MAKNLDKERDELFAQYPEAFNSMFDQYRGLTTPVKAKRKRRTGKTPEGRVKDDVNAFLDHIGAFPFMPSQTFRGKRAVDYIVCWRGKYIVIETKKPGVKEGTANQEEFMRLAREAGGWSFLVDDIHAFVREFAAACRSCSIESPAICSMTGNALLTVLGIPLPKKSEENWSSYPTMSESPQTCPISNDFTPTASKSRRR
jgi:hypothetical protein